MYHYRDEIDDCIVHQYLFLWRVLLMDTIFKIIYHIKFFSKTRHNIVEILQNKDESGSRLDTTRSQSKIRFWICIPHGYPGKSQD